MLAFSEPMSTIGSSGLIAFSCFICCTTPGCGMNAMSGALPAWILVMITWLMLSTRSHLILIFGFWVLSFATSAFSSPSWIGWSRLDQMVTVFPLLLLLLLLPQAVNV